MVHILGETDLKAGLADAVSFGLEKFPALIATEFWGKNPGVVLDMIGRFERNQQAAAKVEITFVPKGQNDKRPVLLMPIEAAVLYQAYGRRIVSILDPTPSKSLRGYGRESTKREAFYALTPAADNDYVVNFDIASCYEYIDHAVLKTILYDNINDSQLADALIALLTRIMGRPVGLPQFNPVSDLLAELYLQPLQDQLVRDGWECLRFVDDFRIRVQGWNRVSAAVQAFSEVTRRHFLVPAANKTRPLGKQAHDNAEARESEAFAAAFGKVKAEAFFYFSDYGTDSLVPVDDADKQVEMTLTAGQILDHWAADPANCGFGTQLIRGAMDLVFQDSVLMQTNWISQVLFEFPLQLNNVMMHLERIASGSVSESAVHKALNTVETSTSNRASDYSDLWLMWTYRRLAAKDVELPPVSKKRITRLTESKSETIRAEAIWTKWATVGCQPGEVLAMYQRATGATRPLLAALACVGDLEPAAVLGTFSRESAANRGAIASALGMSSLGAL